jgi:hypothetical protein
MTCQKFGTKSGNCSGKGVYNSFWESEPCTRSVQLLRVQLLRVRQVLKVVMEILACLSFPKTLMSQGRGQRIFSARSRPPGPFQLFCFAPKTEVFTRQ